MTTRHSKPVPTSLRSAFEADKAAALKHRRLSIERLAELMATTPATLYKWLEQETMPAKALIAWQHLTGANNVARYLAACESCVVVSVPVGRASTANDVHVLQENLNGAVGALLGYMRGDTDRDATIGKLGAALEGLAWHRENVRKSDQPELDLGGE
jgi:hypothetical protein